MGRKIVTKEDIIPYLTRTNQLHLLENLPEGGRNPLSRPVQTVSGVPRFNTADLTPEVTTKGKKRLQMNQTEHEFSLMLEKQRQDGKILLWEYEAITFRYGVMDVITYSPDFVIFDQIEVDDLTPGVPRIKMRFIETKGDFIREKDLLRFKAVRNRFTMFRFELWSKTKESGWQMLY